GRALNSGEGEFADFQIVADPFKPTATSDPHLVQEAPVSHRNVRHHARGSVKLTVCITERCGKVFDDVLAGPASSSHHHRARLEPVEFAVFQVNDGDGTGFGGIAAMLDRYNCG